MFQTIFRMCKYVVKPENSDLTPDEEEIVMSLEGFVLGLTTGLVVVRFVGHVLKPLLAA